MALSFGWRASDVRESIWKGDSALVDVPAGALSAWQEDGERGHLEPYCKNGQPTIIYFRPLTTDEKLVAMGPMANGERGTEDYLRTLILCFRIGVTFADVEESIKTPDGDTRKMIVRERGTRMLAEPVVADIEAKYPGMTVFYGRLIHEASFLTGDEKKASSPPAMPTQSKEAESTPVTTEPSPPAEAATGAP